MYSPNLDDHTGDNEVKVPTENETGAATPPSETPQLTRATRLTQRSRVLQVLQQFENKLDRWLGVETQGIDHIPEDEKRPPSILNAFFMWWSMTVHVGTLQIGILGPMFGLSLAHSAAATVVGIFLGGLCPAFTGLLGAKLGLRAVATSRYAFGFWGAKICSALNVIASIGFGVVNLVVCGQILSAVSDYRMTVVVGIVVVQVATYLIAVFGFSVIHKFEKYAWIFTFVLLWVLVGQTVPQLNEISSSSKKSTPLAGPFLSFLAINISNASGWSTVVGDYYCNYPSSIPAWKLSLLTLLGIGIPTITTTVIGSCLGTLALNSPSIVFRDAYSDHGLGGLLQAIYHPAGFSKFSLVMLMFSVLGENIISSYSSGLSIQLLGDHCHAVPRLLWSLLCDVVTAVLAIAGRDRLAAVVQNFVSLLGYWTVSFTVVLLIEDKWFRRKGGYDLSAWDQPGKLPWGVGAVLSLLTGYLAGGVVGMNQTWFVGPLAAKFQGSGGDIGAFLTAAFTAPAYFFFRTMERRIWGK